jgi:hypothetical protein
MRGDIGGLGVGGSAADSGSLLSLFGFFVRDLGIDTRPDAISPTTCAIRSITSECARSRSNSAVRRATSASSSVSLAGFAGRPAGFGVTASMTAVIAR